MIKEVFHPHELSKVGCQTQFIQRSTSVLQDKDFIELMTHLTQNLKSVISIYPKHLVEKVPHQ